MSSLLAFDTSTESMSIALSGPDGVSVYEGEGGAQASARLIPEIVALMAGAGLRWADLDAIAFGCGPGAFTGLRTACSVAQGLAFGAGKPVIAVDSLLLVAEDARQQQGSVSASTWDVGVAMDARMDEIYAGIYRWDGARWSVLDSPALYAVDALNAHWQAAAVTLRAGSALAAFGHRLTGGASATQVAQPCSRAQALAAIAQQLWADGAAVNAAQALPVYLRDKVAQTTAEREALRAAKEMVS